MILSRRETFQRDKEYSVPILGILDVTQCYFFTLKIASLVCQLVLVESTEKWEGA